MGWLILAALAIGGSLGLLGSGGSILTVPVLLIVLDRPEKLAIAESLAIVGGIALMGAILHAAKSQIHWPTVAWFGLTGMLGAYIGAYGSSFVSSRCQVVCFSLAMLTAAVTMFFAKPPQVQTTLKPPPSSMTMMRNGFFVGGLTGFVGMGGGFMIVPTLVLFGQLPMHLAVGTSLMVIAMNAFTGFTEQFLHLRRADLHVSWQVIGIMTSLGICGSIIGSAISSRFTQSQLRKLFAVFVALVSVYLLL